MKRLFTLLIVFSASYYGSAQTVVFEKNQEIARYNEMKNTSEMVTSVFETEVATTSSQYNEVISVMGAKDGYVSCTLNAQNQLVIVHENWVPVTDIIDVLKSGSVTAIYKSNKEEKLEIQEH